MRARALIFALFAILGLGPLYSIDKTLSLGGSELWRSIERAQGTVLRTGFGGYLDVALADAEYVPTQSTDLLLHFNNAPPEDASGHYVVERAASAETTRYFVHGGGAGMFQGQDRALVLAPATSNALFSPNAVWGDFTVEFWMYTANLQDGATVLLWQNTKLTGPVFLPQELRCSIRAGHLVWSFRNFFLPPSAAPFSVNLEGSRLITPREWHHYLLRFDASTGMIESREDGNPVAVGYANDAGSENGTVYLPSLGAGQEPRLVIGSGFTGFLDELRVSRGYPADVATHKYSLEPGTALTQIFDLGFTDTIVTAIAAHDAKPGATDVYYFYKSANVKTSATELSGEWTQFAPGQDFSAAPPTGRYLQLKLELLPDGAREHSPTVSSIVVSYKPHLPPPAPAYLTARSADGQITLSWRAVVDPSLAGYRIYYGDLPGDYFGTGSASGDSPVDVGNVTSYTLKGLTNGHLYYLAVVAYDASQPPELGPFSNEVPARPSKLAAGSAP